MKVKTGISLSPEVKEVVTQFANQWGMNFSQAVEIIIRQWATKVNDGWELIGGSCDDHRPSGQRADVGAHWEKDA